MSSDNESTEKAPRRFSYGTAETKRLPCHESWPADVRGLPVLPYDITNDKLLAGDHDELPAEAPWMPYDAAHAPDDFLPNDRWWNDNPRALRVSLLNPFSPYDRGDQSYPTCALKHSTLFWHIEARNGTLRSNPEAMKERGHAGTLLVPFARIKNGSKHRDLREHEFIAEADPSFFLPYLNRMLFEYETRRKTGKCYIDPEAVVWEPSDTMLFVRRDARGIYYAKTTNVGTDSQYWSMISGSNNNNDDDDDAGVTLTHDKRLEQKP